MKDITDHKDIIVLVDSFYVKVKGDELLGPVFKNVDWAHHLPRMYDFWSSIVLGGQTFQGNPFQKHASLPINSSHFNHWLKLFTHTVDEHFSGFNADQVKTRATSIAGIFQHKMGLLK
jgi:hemoglobin